MNSVTKLLLVLALVLAAWAAGFFMAGGSGGEKTASNSSVPADVPRAAGTNATSVTNSSPGSRDAATPEERRGRVLSGLLSAMQLPNDLRRFRGMFTAIEQVGADDIQAALELAKKQKGDERRFLVPLIVARWAEFDPQGAASFALTMDAGSGNRWERDYALTAAASEWARKDATGAKAWALGLPGG